jgi:GNAT superfamily N-acetyltransferase
MWALRSAAEFNLSALAELFNAGFAGYVIPLRLSTQTLSERVCNEDIHLGSSAVLLRDGEPAGLGLISRRGRESRLAAMGIVPDARSQGAGRFLMQQLLEEASRRGDARMLLEVFESNAAGRSLYERCGFRVMRRLTGWDLAQPTPAQAALRELDPAGFARHLARADVPRLPWQLEPATLSAPPAGARSFSLDEKVFAYLTAVSDTAIALRGLLTLPEHRRQGHARRMVSALAAHFPGRAIAVSQLLPEGLGAEFFTALEFVPAPQRLLEMELQFA